VTRSRPAREEHASTIPNSRPTSCSSWWFVFVGGYQIFFAWRFGTFYEGEQGDLRKLYRGVAMERPYADIGILAFVVARVAPPVLPAIASYV
jgi:hypothetical protein